MSGKRGRGRPSEQSKQAIAEAVEFKRPSMGEVKTLTCVETFQGWIDTLGLWRLS